MTNFTAFSVLYSFGYSICNGMTYLIPMHHGWLWFPQAPGLVSGIVIGGFGFGALIFAPLATALVNPTGELADPLTGKFSDEVTARVPKMLLELEVCFALLCIISTMLIFEGLDPTNHKNAMKKVKDQQS